MPAAVAAAWAAHAFQQTGAGEGLQHRFEAAPGHAQPVRHLRRAGQGGDACAAAPGVEGDVERHGYGGEGTVAAKQHGGGHLRVFAPKIRGRHVLIYRVRWTPFLP